MKFVHHRPCLTLASILAAAVALAHAEAKASVAIDLFADRSLAGWTYVAGEPQDPATACTVSEDGVAAITGQPAGYFATRAEYRDFRLHVEWRWTDKPGNGGILVHIASGPKDRIWPLCFQVQTKHQRAGDVIPMAGATCPEFPDPATKQVARQQEPSENTPGEWNVADITCRDGVIECSINGVVQNRVTACSPAAGQVGFQLEGVPFELRHFELTPLN